MTKFDAAAEQPGHESSRMADFKKLLVWQKAHALALAVIDKGGKIRGPAFTSLRSQVVRAAMSIDANIAEGRSQDTQQQFLRYLNTAINSAYEVEAHLILARDAKVLKDSDYETLIEQVVEVRRMLYGLCNRIKKRLNEGMPGPDASNP